MSGGSGQGATPLVGRGEEPSSREAARPQRWGPGGGPELLPGPPSFSAGWFLSSSSRAAGLVRGGWRTGRRVEDPHPHAWPLSGCTRPGGPCPARSSVGTAERSAVPCALTDFSFHAWPGPAVCSSLVPQLDVVTVWLTDVTDFVGQERVARRGRATSRRRGLYEAPPPLPGPRLLLPRRRTPALLPTPARQNPEDSFQGSREHCVISGKRRPPAFRQQGHRKSIYNIFKRE